jgi:hypothetical protein
MTESLIEAIENDSRASPDILKEFKQKSSIHFIKGKEIISIVDKHQLFDKGNTLRKRPKKKGEDSVLLNKKVWWHMPKKEKSAFSNSPPPEKAHLKSENRLRRVLDIAHLNM